MPRDVAALVRPQAAFCAEFPIQPLGQVSEKCRRAAQLLILGGRGTIKKKTAI
jgi:hypothetical protein